MSSNIELLVNKDYAYGFSTDIETDTLPPGLNEDVVRAISLRKREPEWLLDWRLKAYRRWLTMREPHWSNVRYTPVDYNGISYYSAPKSAKPLASLDEMDPKIRATYDKLGIPLNEQKLLAGVAVDAVFDSISVGTTYKAELKKHGVIFCSFGERCRSIELVRRYLGSVVPYSDNFFAALSWTSAPTVVCLRAQGVRCPMELSTYFGSTPPTPGSSTHAHRRDEAASVSYLGGTRPSGPPANTRRWWARRWTGRPSKPGERVRGRRARRQRHLQPSKRKAFAGSNISWTQVETGSAISWKYPSVILQGDDSTGEFYSVAVANNHHQPDTGTTMIPVGRNTKSNIVSKGISAGHGNNSYRGQVKVLPKATGARNYTQCDSMLIGNRCGAHTFPYAEVQNNTAIVEHEASTSKIGEDQIFYCKQRGLSGEQAVSMIVSGFCREVFKELPMEFALEAQQLLGITLEGSVG